MVYCESTMSHTLFHKGIIQGKKVLGGCHETDKELLHLRDSEKASGAFITVSKSMLGDV